MVVRKCVETDGRVSRAFGVARERRCATAVLLKPVVLRKSAAAPNAVFADAAPEAVGSPLLKRSAPAPEAVLKLPLVLLNSEYQPTAVFAAPVVRDLRALHPSAVVKLG